MRILHFQYVLIMELPSQCILTIFKGQRNGAVIAQGSHVHYDRSGNVIMTISGRQQNPNLSHQYAQFPSTSFYGQQPPPSYSDIQNGKTPSASYPSHQQRGQYNLGVDLNEDASVQTPPLHEHPPPYERIQPLPN